jgi:hypothetical protein
MMQATTKVLIGLGFVFIVPALLEKPIQHTILSTEILPKD